MTKIKLSNVSKTYTIGSQSIRALQNINLSIEEGEFLAIVGPSGSGKSTLLHLMGGLDEPTNGTLEVDGQNIGSLNDRQLSAFRSEKVGLIFQDFKLQSHLTALENVAIAQMFRRKGKKQSPKSMLKKIDLMSRAKHKPSELSGGQKQRVAIARALINKPSIILADEPTGNLDSITGKHIIDLMKKVHKESGVTMIVVTHDYNIAKHADRIVEIKDGKLIRKNNFKKFFAAQTSV